MIKNLKMKTALTSVITILTILSIALLYATTQSGMTSLMKTSAQNSMKSSLNSQTTLIGEYVNSVSVLLLLTILRISTIRTSSKKHRNIRKAIIKDWIIGKDFMQENGTRML